MLGKTKDEEAKRAYVKYEKGLWPDESQKNDPGGKTDEPYTKVTDQGYNGTDGKRNLRLDVGEIAEVSPETLERLVDGKFAKGHFVESTAKAFDAQQDAKRKALEKLAKEKGVELPPTENRALSAR